MKRKKSKRRKRAYTNQRNIKTVLGVAVIIMLLLIILMLIPEQEQTTTAKGSGSEGASNNQIQHDSGTAKEASHGKHNENPERDRNQVIARNSVPENRRERPEPVKGSISIVIDDVGNSIEELKPFLRLPGHVTFAVLPGLPYSSESSRLAIEAGKDVLLHLPMEALNENPLGPGGITISDDPQKVREIIENDLASVPGAIGVNNHMGSKATADASLMSSVFSALQGKGHFFLDSRTTADSKAMELGHLFDVRVMERNIFLDNVPTADEVRKEFEKGLVIASETGSCIFIGHVQNRAVCEVLMEMLPLIEKKSYTLITLKKLAGVYKT